jgi:hypothetical protein
MVTRWWRLTMSTEALGPIAQSIDPDQKVERVQLGVRMERKMVKVLKGLAEFEGITLGQLLEKIVIHSFEPVPGQEGEMSASPHGKKALVALADLKRVYGFDYDTHATRTFAVDSDEVPATRTRAER